MTIKGKTVGFVGAGNMGEALIKGLLAANRVPAEAIFATDVRPERLKDLDRQYGIQVAAGNVELVRRADVVILAIKRSSSRASRRSPRRKASSPATSTSPARSSARSGVWSCSGRTCWTP